MSTVSFDGDKFIIYGDDYINQFRDSDYIFTEDIGLLIFENVPNTIDPGQYKNIKIRRIRASDINFACEFVKQVPNIDRVVITESIDNLKEFMLINDIDEEITKKTEIIIEVGNIPNLTSAHFTNRHIFYSITGMSDCTKLICENARNIWYDNEFPSIPLVGIDFQKCKYDNLDINADNANLGQILNIVPIKTFTTDLLGMTTHNVDALIEKLASANIHNIMINKPIIYHPDGVAFWHEINIDLLLQNPVLESLQIPGNNKVKYTKEVLEANKNIKQLVITGPGCDQNFIAEVCEANKLRMRYFTTKSARNV